MIKAVMVMNTQGKPRLAKFYEYLVNFCFSFETFNFFLKYFTLLRSFPFGNEDLDLINLFKFFCKNRRGSEFPIELATGEATRAYTKRFCRAENVSNFIQAESIFGPDSRLVYKHFATLYFVLVFDSSENELAVLDLIQVFVETLDKCFKNVCELDIVFNYSKIHTILDEIIFGGQVLETSSTEVMKAVEEISKLEAASNSITLIPKSASNWRSR